MSREDRLAVAFTLCIVGIVGLYFLQRGTPPNGGMSAPVAQLDDSLVRTAPAHDSTARAATQAAVRLSAADSALARAAERSRARADREKARADSLAAVAAAAVSAADSADAWRAAHDARLDETRELRHTVDTLGFRVDTLTAARDTAQAGWVREVDRRLAIERLNAGIKEDLRKATECSISLLVTRVRCPSRTETAVAVLVVDQVVRLLQPSRR